MNTHSIIEALLAAASVLREPATAVASQLLKDLYAATRYYLRRKFAAHADAAQALDFATDKPESVARKATLIEEAEAVGIAADADLVDLATRLQAALPAPRAPHAVAVSVEGKGNHVNVAGRDLWLTQSVVRRNAITPDGRHLARAQRTRLLAIIHELAERLAGPDGAPNRAAVHHLLQRRFEVASYLLIPRERYAEALDFLRAQRARQRDRLQRRDPAAFRRDLFREIFSRATELGWSREQVYQFARDRLGLSQALTSLKPLASHQLRALVAKLRRLAPPGMVL